MEKMKFLLDHSFRFYSIYVAAEHGGQIKVAYLKTPAEAGDQQRP
jgi:hypothetical protein